MHKRVATGWALGILVNLDHFRHLFIPLYQSVLTRLCSKDNYDKVELNFNRLLLEYSQPNRPGVLGSKYTTFSLIVAIENSLTLS